MAEKYSTLKELNVQKGDEVWFLESNGIESSHTIRTDRNGDLYAGKDGSMLTQMVKNSMMKAWRMKSSTPRTWKEMNDDQRKAISLAAMNGETIQLETSVGWIRWDGTTPLSQTHQKIRVKPKSEPETYTQRVWVQLEKGRIPTLGATGSYANAVWGDMKTTMVDGKATKIVWEAD